MRTLKSVFVFALLVLSCVAAQAQLNANFTANVVSGCAPLVVNFTNQSSGNPTLWSWTFGNGNSSTGSAPTNINPTAVYATPGTYTVSLTVTGAGGATDTETKTAFIVVRPNPVANFSAVPGTSVCIGNSLTFQNQTVVQPGGSSVLSYNWNFGNGASSTALSPVYTYTATGTYNVSLTVTDANGCSDAEIKTGYITVNPKPNITFTNLPTTFCQAPSTVAFTSSVTGVPATGLSYQWSFGNGSTGTGANPSHTYTAPGSFTPQAIVITPAGCRDTFIRPTPLVIPNYGQDFTGTPTTQCAASPIPVVFTANAVTGATSYAWAFGDGTTATGLTASKSYSGPGTYSVTLTIILSNGCTLTVNKPNYILINPPAPAINFIFNPAAACVFPATVGFTAVGAGIANWAWTFGNGNTGTGANPSTIYPNAGPFTVTLTGTTAAGCSTSVTQTINLTPTVSITPAWDPVCTFPRQYTFTATTNFPGAISQTLWDLGQGAPAGTANSAMYNTNLLPYNIQAILVTASGCSLTSTLPLLVQAPDANFTFTPNPVCYGSNLRINNLSVPNDTVALQTLRWFQSGVDTALWYSDSINHLITSPRPVRSLGLQLGTYQVELITIDNINLCLDTHVVSITINGPKAQFSVADSNLCATPFVANFTNQTVGTVTTTSWLFPSGTPGTSSLVNPPAVTYPTTNPGGAIFNNRLIVSHAGCADTAFRTVSVGPPIAVPPAPTTNRPNVCFPDTITFHSPWTPAAGYQGQHQFQLVHPTNPALSQNSGLISTPFFAFDSVAAAAGGTVYGMVYTFVPALSPSCSSSVTAPAVVTARPKPNITFPTASGPRCFPHVYTLNAVTSPAASGPTSIWTWSAMSATPTPPTSIGATSSASMSWPANGTYPVTAIVVNEFGCRDTGTISVAYSPPVVSVVAQRDTVCSDSISTVFDANSTTLAPNATARYTWDFGDGTTAFRQGVDTTLPKTYAAPGNYTVTLIATRADSCRDTVSLPISVVSPSLDFTSSGTTAACPPFNVDMQVVATPDLSGFNWNFGNGSFATNLDSVAASYPFPGSYTVTVQAISTGECTLTVAKPNYIQVTGPVGTITTAAGGGQGCQPFTTSLIASSSTPGVEFSWDLGDGTFLQNASDTIVHTYMNAGSFTPLLVLVDTNDCTVAYPLASSVLVNAAPPVQITNGDTAVTCAAQPLVLTATGATNGYTWTPATDLSSDTVANPSFNGAASQQYIVAGADSIGCLGYDTVWVDVRYADILTPDTSLCPGVWFQLVGEPNGISYQWLPNQWLSTPTLPTTNVRVYDSITYALVTEIIPGCFDTARVTVEAPDLGIANAGPDALVCDIQTMLAATAPPAGIAAVWQQLAGPNTAVFGSTTNPATPLTGLVDGAYELGWQHSGLGCTLADTVVLTVLEPVVAPTVAIDSICVGGSPSVAVLNPQPNTVYTLENPVGTLLGGPVGPGAGPLVLQMGPQAGPATVTLVATRGACLPAAVGPVVLNVFPRPEAHFGPAGAYACLADTATLLDSTSSVLPISAWLWALGDGATDARQNPTHIYTATGSYTVQLIVSAPYDGCVDTLLRNGVVTVVEGPRLAITTSASPLYLGGDTRFEVFQNNTVSQVGAQLGHDWRFFLSGQTSAAALPPAAQYTEVSADTLFYIATDVRSGCTSDTAIFIQVLEGPSLVISNVITPNADGVNDVLRPLTVGPYRLVVSDRWGKVVHAQRNQPWAPDTDVLEGVYFYELEIELPQGLGGGTETRAGSVTVLR